MHYKNGREAHNGDKVMMATRYGPVANLTECLHLDDALDLLGVPARAT